MEMGPWPSDFIAVYSNTNSLSYNQDRPRFSSYAQFPKAELGNSQWMSLKEHSHNQIPLTPMYCAKHFILKTFCCLQSQTMAQPVCFQTRCVFIGYNFEYPAFDRVCWHRLFGFSPDSTNMQWERQQCQNLQSKIGPCLALEQTWGLGSVFECYGEQRKVQGLVVNAK